jgi:hypothetical protein
MARTDKTIIPKLLPVRTTRRLPPYLEEFYEVAFNSDKIKIPSTIAKNSSKPTKRETLKSTASPKKKNLPKRKSISTRPALAAARSDSYTSSYKNSRTVSYTNSGIRGTTDRSKWALSSATLDTSYDIERVLSGCYYHPGVLKPVNVTNVQHSIEICFCFDTTGSMASCIGDLKHKLQAMMEQLLKDVPTIKIALMGVGDYCDANSSYVINKLDFSNDVDTLVGYLQALRSTGGGDSEEAYELALMETQTLSWTTGVDEALCTKCVVMIGDDLPHPKTSYLNIDWKDQVNNIRDKIGAKIYSVQCMDRSYANDFYQTMADETLGQRFVLANFSAMAELFMAVCYREATEHAEKTFTNDDKINDNGVSIVRPDSSLGSSSLSDEDMLKIHIAIHDKSVDKVTIGDVEYDISVGTAACRFVRINDITYIEQNKEKKTKYARMALEGKKITWIVHAGSWGLIVDDSILRR